MRYIFLVVGGFFVSFAGILAGENISYTSKQYLDAKEYFESHFNKRKYFRTHYNLFKKSDYWIAIRYIAKVGQDQKYAKEFMQKIIKKYDDFLGEQGNHYAYENACVAQRDILNNSIIVENGKSNYSLEEYKNLKNCIKQQSNVYRRVIQQEMLNWYIQEAKKKVKNDKKEKRISDAFKANENESLAFTPEQYQAAQEHQDKNMRDFWRHFSDLIERYFDGQFSKEYMQKKRKKQEDSLIEMSYNYAYYKACDMQDSQLQNFMAIENGEVQDSPQLEQYKKLKNCVEQNSKAYQDVSKKHLSDIYDYEQKRSIKVGLERIIEEKIKNDFKQNNDEANGKVTFTHEQYEIAKSHMNNIFTNHHSAGYTYLNRLWQKYERAVGFLAQGDQKRKYSKEYMQKKIDEYKDFLKEQADICAYNVCEALKDDVYSSITIENEEGKYSVQAYEKLRDCLEQQNKAYKEALKKASVAFYNYNVGKEAVKSDLEKKVRSEFKFPIKKQRR